MNFLVLYKTDMIPTESWLFELGTVLEILLKIKKLCTNESDNDNVAYLGSDQILSISFFPGRE